MLHPDSWSLEGQDHVLKIKRDKIFPENYVMRARPRGHNYKHKWMYIFLEQLFFIT